METAPSINLSNTKYFTYISVAFVAILIISNTIASKLFQFGPLVLSVSIIIFPISYIFGDILTEVYGYRASRKIIWSGFAAVLFMSIIYYFAVLLPPVSYWTNHTAFALILGSVPRIVFAGIIAYFFGEFSNSFVMSRMKVWANGQHLWTRVIGSTVVGEAIDTMFFYTIAFFGTIPFSGLITVIWSAYVFKVTYEVVAMPLTYKIVGALKRVEGVDVYDRGINYNPFVFTGE
jgi:uncharacterized integral membrane protein (TIGR00697 family)